MLIITEISIETRNEFTKSAILCQKVTIFHRQELASLFQVQEKFKVCRNSKCNFSSRIIVWLPVVDFTEHDILNFWGNVHLLRYYLMKAPQNCFEIFVKKALKFPFVLDK